jgi:tetratricopeptide (TPR) repeat protein
MPAQGGGGVVAANQRLAQHSPAVVGIVAGVGTFIGIAASLPEQPNAVRLLMGAGAGFGAAVAAWYGLRLAMRALPGHDEQLRERFDTIRRFVACGNVDEARRAYWKLADDAKHAKLVPTARDALLELADFERGIGRISAAHVAFDEAKTLTAATAMTESIELRRVEGELQRVAGANDDASDSYTIALALAELECDVLVQAMCRLGLAKLELARGKLESCARQGKEAERLFRSVGGVRGSAGSGHSLLVLARLADTRAQGGHAIELVDQARTSFNQVGDRRGQLLADVLSLWLRHGNPSPDDEEVERQLDRCIERAREYQDIYIEGECLTLRGRRQTSSGASTSAAMETFDTCLGLYRRAGDRAFEAKMLVEKAYVASLQHQPTQTQQLLNYARAITRDLHDNLGEADISVQLADWERVYGKVVTARTLYAEARTLYARSDSPIGVVRVGEGLGELEAHAGNLDIARTHLDAALSQNIELKADQRAHVLLRLGQVDFWLGNVDRARSHYRTAIAQFASMNQVVALGYQMLAELEWQVDKPDESARHLDTCADFYDHGGFKLESANIQRTRGEISRDRGGPEARDLLQSALATFTEMDEAEGAGECELALARLDLGQHDHDAAVDRCQNALRWFARNQYIYGQVDATIVLSEARLARGDVQQVDALSSLVEARDRARSTGFLLGEARACEAMARAAELQGRRPDAVRWACLAADLFARLGMSERSQTWDAVSQRLLESLEAPQA